MRADDSSWGEVQRWCADAGWVRALAGQLIADADLADDLAQEAWVRALRGPRPAPGAFRAWIAAVLRNLVASERRGGERRARHERGVEPPASTEDPLAASARLEAHELLVAAVRSLDEPYRSAIVLRYFEGLGPRAIAARTGAPVRTVHTRLQRAMAQLRARLEARDRRWPALLAPLALPGRGAALLLMTTKIKLGVLAAVGAASIAVLAWPRPEGSAPAVPPSETTGALWDAPGRGAAAPTPVDVPGRSAVEAPSSPPAAAAAAPTPWPLTGSVLDLEGRPVGRVAVAFTAFGHGAAEARAETADDGTFALSMPHVAGGHVDVDDPAWTAVYRPVLWGQRDVGELTVVVARAAPVAGAVVDEAGAGIEGAAVSVFGAVPARAGYARSLERAVGAEWQATTGADGRFEIARAPVLPGMRLHADRSGYEPARLDLTVREALRVELRSIRSILEGQVLDHEGRPAAAMVFCGSAAAQAGADGRFAIDLGAAGEDPVRHNHRWLVAQKRGFLPARLRCEGDQPRDPTSWPRPLVLRLAGAALSIRGRVLRADGTPVESPSVRALDLEYLGDASGEPGSEMSSVEFMARVEARATEGGAEFSDWDAPREPGGFEVRGLQERAYRLLVEDAAALLSLVTEPIRAGTEDLELRLPAEAMWPPIAGRVVDRRGDPVAGAGVWFELGDFAPSARSETERLETDADGRFARGPLALAAQTVLVQAPGIAHGTRFDLAMLGDVGDLRLVAPVKASVRIVATPASRAAHTAAFLGPTGDKIAATITQGNMAWGTYDVPLVDGQSEVITVPDDAVSLVLEKGGRELLRVPVDLTPGAVRELRL